MKIEVIVYFNNGTTIKRKVDRLQALGLVNRSTAIIPEHADLMEVHGVSDVYLVPTILLFAISTSYVPAISRPTKRSIYNRDNGVCAYCERKLTHEEATIDHIYPESRGGKSTWENLVTACGKCNHKKDNRTPKEARMRMQYSPGHL